MSMSFNMKTYQLKIIYKTTLLQQKIDTEKYVRCNRRWQIKNNSLAFYFDTGIMDYLNNFDYGSKELKLQIIIDRID